ncbi:MAG: beta-lactamase family protein [Saprospiraceae bacterium]|nr:beta-lactamase family protein [Saprospiraceae bacterium]
MKQLIILLCFPVGLFCQIDTIHQLLNTKLDHAAANPVHSILLQIDRVGDTSLVRTAVGWANGERELAQPTHQFRVASITKLFVATVILQLVEENKVKLEDRVVDLFRKHAFLPAQDLHIHQEENFSGEINLEHLLSHRSGLADIFTDRWEAFFAKVFSNPQHTYTPKQIVELYFQYGLQKAAHFRPGEGFAYSDMNYVILGLLIEEIEGQPLADVLRKRIITPLQLTDTYFEFYEEEPKNKRLLHQWYGAQNMSLVNTSFDWAGGGLVSNLADLGTFIQALFSDQLLSPNSLKQMIQMGPSVPQEDPYGLGIYATTFGDDLYYGHFGFYGSYAGYCPQKKLTLVYNISQGDAPFRAKTLVEQVLKLIN